MISYEELSEVFDMENPLTLEYFELVDKNTNEPKYFHKHHILPEAIFHEYRRCKWNIVKLKYEDHYLAHKILPNICLRSDHKVKMKFAWCMMAYRDDIKGFISVEEFSEINKTHAKIISITMKGRVMSEESKTKRRETCMEIYGVENPWTLPEIREKSKATILEKFGVDHVMRSDVVKCKVIATSIERYGVEHAMQCEEIKDRLKESIKNKFGVDHQMRHPDIAEKYRNSRSKFSYEQYSMNGELLFVFDSRKELIEAGFSQSNVNAVIKGRRPHHKGFIWKRIPRQKDLE